VCHAADGTEMRRPHHRPDGHFALRPRWEHGTPLRSDAAATGRP
jgi:hypothetical protein